MRRKQRGDLLDESAEGEPRAKIGELGDHDAEQHMDSTGSGA